MSVLFYPESIRILGSDANGNNIILCEMAVDDIANLPAANAFISDGYVLSMGCVATAINDNSKHRLNGSGNWVQIAAGTSTYTRAEIDVFLSAIDAEIAEDRAALVELVDEGAKNIFDIDHLDTGATYNATYGISNGVLSVTSNGSYGRLSTAFTLPSGTYVMSCNVSNISIAGGTSAIRITLNPSGVNPIVKQKFTSSQSLNLQFTLSEQSTVYIMFYMNESSTSYANSADFSNIMICTKAAWNSSHAYEPYAPTNRQLYEMILQLQGG